jgi:hypothetical protein
MPLKLVGPKEKVIAAIRQGMSRSTALTQAGIFDDARAEFVLANERDMDKAEADFESDWIAKASELAETYDNAMDMLSRRRKGWRSPEVKLKAEIARAEAERALTAAPPTQQTWTLAEIERELALRRGLVQVIEAKPQKDAVDLKLLNEYRGDDEPESK